MKKLGVIGGVGPLSSVYYYNRLVLRTKADSDQEHMDMIILNHSTIPDRTNYILDHSKPNPISMILDDIRFLENAGVDLITIPCNTAMYFYDEISESTKVKVLNIIDLTIQKLINLNLKKIVLFSTTGTLNAHLYQNCCDEVGITCIEPDIATQNKVMDFIYQIKAGNFDFKDEFLQISEQYDCPIILGCTELSVLVEHFNLSQKYIDPMCILTEQTILQMGYELRD